MRVRGRVRPPGDKSITHRALLLGALATGPVEVRGALAAHDTRAMAAALRKLGAQISAVRSGRSVRLTGTRWRDPASTLHCGNSGTAARLLLGALAGQPIRARLTGDRSLRGRPMARVTDPLRLMGARISGGDTLPLTIEGRKLTALDYRAPVASAQLKSALLLAGLVSGVAVRVEEPWTSRDHTERFLTSLGYDIRCVGTAVEFTPGPHLRRPPAFSLDVPGDPSSAAFFVACGVLADAGDLLIEDVGVNPTRTGFLDVLSRMGALVTREREREVGGEPVADLRVAPAPLHGTEVLAGEVPRLVDEVPILAVVASRAEGTTVFREVGELRVKESNRLALLAANLRAVGAAAEVDGEDLYVEGGGSRGGSAPSPRGRVETAGDHRMAMSFAVLGTLSKADVTLSEKASPAVSYPAFFRDLALVTNGVG